MHVKTRYQTSPPRKGVWERRAAGAKPWGTLTFRAQGHEEPAKEPEEEQPEGEENRGTLIISEMHIREDNVLIVYFIHDNELRLDMAEQNGLVTLPTSKEEGYSDKGFCY